MVASSFVFESDGPVLKPVRRQSVSDAVFEQLRDRIVGGEMGPGTSLPPERELSKVLGVNRQAVREALKRLEQMRLVSIHHGGGTRVADFKATGYLDLLEALVRSGESVDTDVLRSIMEMRSALAPHIARRAASRASVATKDELDQCVGAMCRAENLSSLHSLSIRFWTTVVEGSQNLAYRLAHNTLTAAYEPFGEILGPALEEELTDLEAYAAVATAIRLGDEEAAEALAQELSAKGERGLSRVEDALDALARTGNP